MRISDWSSDVCSSDLLRGVEPVRAAPEQLEPAEAVDGLDVLVVAAHVGEPVGRGSAVAERADVEWRRRRALADGAGRVRGVGDDVGLVVVEVDPLLLRVQRSEEHTSELQSLLRISYAVFGLK